jgi:hypothetical protein
MSNVAKPGDIVFTKNATLLFADRYPDNSHELGGLPRGTCLIVLTVLDVDPGVAPEAPLLVEEGTRELFVIAPGPRVGWLFNTATKHV